MLDNLSIFNTWTMALLVFSCFALALAVLVYVDARKAKREGRTKDANPAVAVVPLAFMLVFMWGAYLAAKSAYDYELLQARMDEQRIAAQQQLGLSDWERDHLVFSKVSLTSGMFVRRIEGCRLEFDFTTNSNGEYTFIAGSGTLSDELVQIKPYELDDGSVVIHSQDECEEIGRTWSPSI